MWYWKGSKIKLAPEEAQAAEAVRAAVRGAEEQEEEETAAIAAATSEVGTWTKVPGLLNNDQESVLAVTGSSPVWRSLERLECGELTGQTRQPRTEQL